MLNLNKKAKTLLAYSLLIIITLFSIIFLANAVIAYNQGNAALFVTYNLVTQDIAGRHYTPTCFGTCDLVFSLSYTGSVASNSVSIDINKLQTQFSWIKGEDKFQGSEIYYLYEYQEQVTDYSTICNSYNTTEWDAFNNTYFYPYFNNCITIASDSHLETRQQWQKLSTLTLEKGKTYYFDIRGYFKPSFDSFRVDVVPLVSIAGTNFKLAEMALWYNDYDYRRKDNVSQTTPSYLTNFTYPINGSGGFNIGGGQVLAWTSIDVLPPSSLNGTQYLYYSANGSAVEVNGTSDQQRPVDCESTANTCTSYHQTDVWLDATFVGHNITKDSSANNLNVTLSPIGSATQVEVNGYIGKALNFSSSATAVMNNVTIHDVPSMNDWTVSMWIKFSKVNVRQLVIASNISKASFNLDLLNTGKLRMDYSDSCDTDFLSNQVLLADTWYYVTWYISRLGERALYINGIKDINSTETCNMAWVGDSMVGTIWYFSPISTFPLFGEIDELRIQDRIPTPNEIKAQYQMMRYNYSSLGKEEINDTIPPETTQPIITPPEPKTLDDLKCNATLTDNRAVNITAIWKWYKNNQFQINGSTQVQNGTESLITTLLAGNTSKGEQWICEVKPFDGHNYGNASNSTPVTIINTAPNQSMPKLQATSKYNTTSDNITCSNQSTQDADNDKVTNIYNWYKNSQPLAVLNMPFENSAKDYSGKGNNGTLKPNATDGPQFIINGQVGRALQFDSIDDYVKVSDSNSLDITNEITLEAWVYPIAKPTWGGIIDKANADNELTYRLSYPSGVGNDKVRFKLWKATDATLGNVYSNTALTLYSWSHIVGTFNGTDMRLYINGIEQSDTETGLSGTIQTNNRELVVGALNRGTNNYFNGTIDEVKIYPYALTAEQIKQRYEETKDGFSSSSTIVAQETTPGETFMCQVTPNDAEEDGDTLNSTSLLVMPPAYNITFNVTDSISGILLSPPIDSINCNNSLIANNQPNPAGPYVFYGGSYECLFVEDFRYNKLISLTVDQSKTIIVPMSEKKDMTVEEHNWLEALYQCIINGDCTAFKLWETTNQTVFEIWKKVFRTDRSVVTQENIISNTLSNTSNITIDYTIQIPFKIGYSNGELLPLRMFFWFHNGTTCYNQDKITDSNRAETPYCFPLIAETLGPNNGSVTFIVDLRPNLPTGTYNITRAIEIDPILESLRTWINYGQEIIGTITVLESGDATINLVKLSEEKKQEYEKSKITGKTISNFKELIGNPSFFFGVIVTLLVLSIIFNIWLISKTKKKV